MTAGVRGPGWGHSLRPRRINSSASGLAQVSDDGLAGMEDCRVFFPKAGRLKLRKSRARAKPKTNPVYWILTLPKSRLKVVIALTRIRLQVAIYFCLHRGNHRPKGCRGASPQKGHSRLFEIALVLVRFEHVTGRIVKRENANDGCGALRVADCIVDRVRPGDINRRYRSSELVGSSSRREFRERSIECFLFLALDFFQLSPLMRINAGYDCAFYEVP